MARSKLFAHVVVRLDDDIIETLQLACLQRGDRSIAPAVEELLTAAICTPLPHQFLRHSLRNRQTQLHLSQRLVKDIRAIAIQSGVNICDVIYTHLRDQVAKIASADSGRTSTVELDQDGDQPLSSFRADEILSRQAVK